jgi:hypothetical protein
MTKKTRQVQSKYPAGTPCAYCTEVIPILEEEHVFPDSWYASGTPKPEMMLVPACRSCNGFYSQMDGDARILVLTCEPDDPLTRSVQDRVRRSFDPKHAKSGVDRRARAHRLKSLQDALCVVSEHELNRAIWSVGQTREHVTRRTPSGIYLTGRPGMRIPPSMQPTIVEKWTRGAYYYSNARPMSPYARWSWVSPTAAGDPSAIIRMCSERMELVFDRPEFRVWGVTTESDPGSSLWMFALWNKMVFFGLTGRFADEDAVRTIQHASLG